MKADGWGIGGGEGGGQFQQHQKRVFLSYLVPMARSFSERICLHWGPHGHGVTKLLQPNVDMSSSRIMLICHLLGCRIFFVGDLVGFLGTLLNTFLRPALRYHGVG